MSFLEAEQEAVKEGAVEFLLHIRLLLVRGSLWWLVEVVGWIAQGRMNNEIGATRWLLWLLWRKLWGEDDNEDDKVCEERFE